MGENKTSRYIDAMQFLTEKKLQYCQDCENRKGIKNGKKVFCYEIGDAPCRSCGIQDMFDAIEDYPAEDVAPIVHAHWIVHERAEEHCGLLIPNFECTNCHLWVRADGAGNFCPDCGAKMDEEEQG